MTTQRAVVVGVGRSGTMTELHGARTGAAEIADWLEQNSFEVTRLIDDGRTVALADVYSAVEAAADPTKTERLFVYFAGHGITKGPGRDVWLLSPGTDNPNEHINADLSLSFASKSGVQHVAVFVDTCRSPFTEDYYGVEGGSIFPNNRSSAAVQLDKFYATQPGTTAVEIAPHDNPFAAYGVFTKALMEALRGEVRAAAEPVGGRLGVTSQSLGRWLKSEVQLRSSTIADARVQDPDYVPAATGDRRILAWVPSPPEATLTVRVSPRKPTATVRILVQGLPGQFSAQYDGPPPAVVRIPCPTYYVVVVDQPQRSQPPETANPRALVDDEQLDVKTLAKDRGPGAPPKPPSPIPPETQRIDVVVLDDNGVAHATAPHEGLFQVVTTDVITGDNRMEHQVLRSGQRPTHAAMELDQSATEAVEKLVHVAARSSFETATGFTFDGTEILAAVATGGPPLIPGNGDLFVENGLWHVRGHEAGSLVAVRPDGTWVTGALLPGFIGAAVVAPHGTTGLTYRAAPGGPWYSENDSEVLRAEAIGNAAMLHGQFAAWGDTVAKYLRRYKHVEPALGVLAAYAYDAVGHQSAIRNMVDAFQEMDQTVPFDVWLLAGLEKMPATGVAPGFPLLARGWSYLDESNAHPAVLAARPHLAPAAWTTLRRPGGEELAAAVARGDV